MTRIVLAKRLDDDEDEVIRDGKSVRVALHMMDDEKPTPERIKMIRNQAAEKCAERTANAWRQPLGQTEKVAPPKPSTQSPDQAYEAMVERTKNAWKQQ